MKRRIIIFSFLILVLVFSGCSNQPPVAENASISVDEDSSVNITLAASDLEGDTLTWEIQSRPVHGRLSGTEPNLVYTPQENFNGFDSFSFIVNDGKSDSGVASVSISIKAVNDEPAAEDDQATVAEDVPILTIDVLKNDSDPDEDELLIFGVTQGSSGQVTITTDNTLTYKPNKDFNGYDSFVYTLSDGHGGTAKATVDVTVTSENDAPEITSEPVLSGRVWGKYEYQVEAEDVDSADKLKFALTEAPEGMTIAPDTGLIEFSPTSEQSGDFNVTVEAEDNAQNPASDTQSFTISIASLDEPLEEKMNIEDLYIPGSGVSYSPAGVKDTLLLDDDKTVEVPAGNNMCLDFSDVFIPQGGKIASIVLFIVHYEDKAFPDAKLQWNLGTGWPASPKVYSSMNAPVRAGLADKAMELWDITGVCDTPEKINSLQLYVENKSSSSKTYLDNIYAVIKWY